LTQRVQKFPLERASGSGGDITPVPGTRHCDAPVLLLSENGVLLRADLHRLFDQGYITITPQQRIEVSGRLSADYENGGAYYPLHG
jgi:HNH endonuclease